MRLTQRFGRLAAFALALVAMLGIASPASAQGTSGQVPDPMSTSQSDALMKAYIRPTKEQAEAIERLHDSYLERFRALRENEIERFLTKMKEMGGAMPSRAQVDEFTKGYERVNKQIADVDDSYFDAIVTLLGEERRGAVTRARDARSRTRVLSGVMAGMMGQYNLVDLSPLVLDLGLSPTERDQADVVLLNYEQRLTASMKELAQVGMRMMRDLFEELEKAGFGEMSQEDMMADPERMKGMMEAFQASFAKVSERFQAKYKDVSEFNGQTFRTLEGQLTGDLKRKLRVRYIARAYPEIGNDPANAENLFRMALRVRALSNEVREQIRTAYTNWQNADNAIADQAIKAIDQERATRNIMDFAAGMSESMKRSQELTQKRRDLGTDALKSLSAVVGDERLQKLIAKATDTKKDQFEETDDPEAGEDAGASTPQIAAHAKEMQDYWSMFSRASDREPMDATLVDSIATQLALDDARKAIVDVMYSDYAKKWEAEIGSAKKRMEEYQRKLQAKLQETASQAAKNSAKDGATDVQVTVESIEGNLPDMGDMSEFVDNPSEPKYYEKRRQRMTKASEMDDAFFTDLGHALGESAKPVLALARLERVLERCSGSGGGAGMAYMGMWGGAPEVPVNFVEVLRTAELSAEDRAKVSATLAPMIDTMIKSQLESVVAELEQDRAMMELTMANAKIYQAAGEERDLVALQKASMDMMAIQQRKTDAVNRRTEASRSAWNTVLAALSETPRSSLQMAFDSRAHPTIFKDRSSALPYIKHARDLHNLTVDQKQQLQTLYDKYQSEHLELSRKMIPKGAAGTMPTDPKDMQRYWQEEMERANAREKVRFERDERSQRAIAQLRRVLTEEQIKLVAGLSEYEKTAKEGATGAFGQIAE